MELEQLNTASSEDELLGNYTTLCVFFNEVSHMAYNGTGGWVLTESGTHVSDEYYFTQYSNGKHAIEAKSQSGVHRYTFYTVQS